MTITKQQNGTDLTILLEGWLDTTTSGELGAEIDRLEDLTSLTLDFDKLEYISSAGLRQVVASARKAKAMQASFAVTNAGTEVMSVFRLTGLDKKMNISGK